MKSIYTCATYIYTTGLRPKLSCRAFTRRTLSRLALPVLLATGLLLTACQPTKPGPGGKGYTTEQILVQRAEDLLQQAAGMRSPQREALQLEAAEALIKAQQPNHAQQILANINSDILTLPPLARYTLMRAELALAEDNFFVARDLLTHPALEQHWRGLPIDMQQRWHHYRADLFALLGEEQRSINEYIALSSILSDNDAITEVHQQLWQTLSRIPHNRLQALLETEKNRVLHGWYTLADISRNNQGDINGLQGKIENWQQNWSWHPAALYPPEGLNDIKQVADNLPRQLALLLPLSSKDYGRAAEVVRNGFMSAYYQVMTKGGTPPSIHIYDTAGGSDIQTLYNQAVSEGAEMVIGPLIKEKVEQLNQMISLPVPTISLNYLQNDLSLPASNLLQFGLSTANEARQVAQRAWLEGHRRAIAITPNSNLGRRTLAAFQSEWESRGGMLVTAVPYENGQVDFKPLIKPALLIDQSEQRTNRLARLLGKKPKATPEHRRQDLDMVFMHSSPVQARQIKPMLDFFYAGDLPVYATSQIYNGKVDRGKDQDLNRVRFCAMPWTLPGTLTEGMTPDRQLHANLQNLFALGLDAYKIHQGVLQMKILPNTRLFGSTGTLKLDQNRIVREQPWAEFRGGKVRPASRPASEQ